MGSSHRGPASRGLFAGVFAAGLALALSIGARADAQAKPPVPFQVTVLQTTEKAGPIDPRAERWNQLLEKKIRYGSLHLVQSQQLTVALDGIGSVTLPTGKEFRFRPIDVGPGGVLVAVDLKGTVDGDFRIPRGKPLIIGGQPHGGGQLVVVLEASP
jgi:hypothetical protein